MVGKWQARKRPRSLSRIARKRRIQVNRGEILPEENEYDPANNEQEIGQYDLKRDFDIRKR